MVPAGGGGALVPERKLVLGNCVGPKFGHILEVFIFSLDGIIGKFHAH